MDTMRLRELVTTDGPFASVYFNDTHDTEDALTLRGLRWRELRNELAGQGTSEVTLDTLESAVHEADPPVGSSGRALVAADDVILLDRELDEPPARPVARLSDLPYLVPLLEHGEIPPPHVVAVTDRVGAEVTAVDQQGNVVDERTIEGVDQVHKVSTGGWAHRTVQQHIDELVKQNVDQVAEYIVDTTRRIGATVIVIAGESQARKALLDALPEMVREQATEFPGGSRKPDERDTQLEHRVKELLVKDKQTRRDQTAERFRIARDQPPTLAVEGLEATISALSESNVETLLLNHPADIDVLTGPDPTLLSTQEEALKIQGAEPITAQRADEALVAAAIATDADIVYTGDRLALVEGYGAILRHD